MRLSGANYSAKTPDVSRKQKQNVQLYEVIRIHFSINAAHDVPCVICFKLSAEWFNQPIHLVSRHSRRTVGARGFSEIVLNPELLQHIHWKICSSPALFLNMTFIYL